jgi:hypothetical protein
LLKLQDLELKLSDRELHDMISDASVSGRNGVTESEYVQLLKHSTWM